MGLSRSHSLGGGGIGWVSPDAPLDLWAPGVREDGRDEPGGLGWAAAQGCGPSGRPGGGSRGGMVLLCALLQAPLMPAALVLLLSLVPIRDVLVAVVLPITIVLVHPLSSPVGLLVPLAIGIATLMLSVELPLVPVGQLSAVLLPPHCLHTRPAMLQSRSW